MFNRAFKFNQNISGWNVEKVENMQNMFTDDLSFNQPINLWKVNKDVNTEEMLSHSNLSAGYTYGMKDRYENLSALTWETGSSVTKAIIDKEKFFNTYIPLDGDELRKSVDSSNSSYITNERTYPIEDWNVELVEDMANVFFNEKDFNQDISKWNTSSAKNMNGMFQNASEFNKNISDWKVENVISMSGMFQNAKAFNQPLNNWKVDNVKLMLGMFDGAENFNKPLNGWNVEKVQVLEKMFKNAKKFNQDITGWDVNLVHTMKSMFEGATEFNQNIRVWKTKQGAAFDNMFQDATAMITRYGSTTGFANTPTRVFFNYILVSQFKNNGGVAGGNADDIHYAVSIASQNSWKYQEKHISEWDVSQVQDMKNLFLNQKSFNENITGWNVQNVRNMSGMFQNAETFNQNIKTNGNKWNVGNVTDMSNMFRSPNTGSNFNQPIGNWNVGNVNNMSNMFWNAKNFKQEIYKWNVKTNANLTNMFIYATGLNDKYGNMESFRNTPTKSGNLRFFGFDDKLTNVGAGAFSDGTLRDWMKIRDNIHYAVSIAKKNNKWLYYGKQLKEFNVSNVTNMNKLFQNTNFNQTLKGWNVSNVLYAQYMFDGCSNFNQPLHEQIKFGKYLRNVRGMFGNCTSWHPYNVANLKNMFTFDVNLTDGLALISKYDFNPNRCIGFLNWSRGHLSIGLPVRTTYRTQYLSAVDVVAGSGSIEWWNGTKTLVVKGRNQKNIKEHGFLEYEYNQTFGGTPMSKEWFTESW